MLEQTSPTGRVQLIAYAALLTSGSLAAFGFGLRGLWIDMLVSLAFTALVLFAETTRWRDRLAGTAFVGLAVLGGGGLLRGIPALLGLVSVAAALVGWDLRHFAQRLLRADRIEAEDALVSDHVERLLITVGLGLGLGGLSLLIQVNYDVGVLFLLGLILVVGLTLAVSYLRRESD